MATIFHAQVLLLLLAMPVGVPNPVTLSVFQLRVMGSRVLGRGCSAQATTSACTSATDSEERTALLQKPGHVHGASDVDVIDDELDHDEGVQGTCYPSLAP